MSESDDLKDAIAEALECIKEDGLLGVRGEACVIEHQTFVIRNAAVISIAYTFVPQPQRVQKIRRNDRQEWYGFGVYFALDEHTPCYEEMYLSYPKGELALRRPVDPRQPGLLRLIVTDEAYLNDVHALDGCITGIDMINEHWSGSRLPMIQTPEYVVCLRTPHRRQLRNNAR